MVPSNKMAAGAEAEGQHVELQSRSRKRKVERARGFELPKSTHSNILLPARPYLLNFPNSTTSWGPKFQSLSLQGTFTPQHLSCLCSGIFITARGKAQMHPFPLCPCHKAPPLPLGVWAPSPSSYEYTRLYVRHSLSPGQYSHGSAHQPVPDMPSHPSPGSVRSHRTLLALAS